MERTRNFLTSNPAITAILWVMLAHLFGAAQNRAVTQISAINQNPPSRVARLTQIQGQVSIQPAGVNDWTQAFINYPVTTGDRIYVDSKGQAELQLEQTVVHVWRYSDLSVTDLSDTIAQFGLSQGSLHVRTFELNHKRPVEVDTPNGSITVTQPGDFRIDCYMADGGTLVTVNTGEVHINGPGISRSLAQGQSGRLLGTGPITLTSQTMPGKDLFDVWSQQRDRKLLSSETRQYVDPSTIGSNGLDQYGTWTDTPAYGPIWYPTGVSVGWVPYSTGRWVWASPWGWTWVDAEPWGFAPFHYGRWAYYGNRWGWLPGPVGVTPTYSPALVGFVEGPGFSVRIRSRGGIGVSAWFPLGPGEPYFPWYHCTPEYFSQMNVTNIHRVTISRVTSIADINDTNYYNYYHNKTTFDKIRYANLNLASTAVSSNQFSSGRMIAPQTSIHLTDQQLAHAELIPHPFVTPTVRSVVPHPVVTVPVARARPNLITPQLPSPAKAAARSSEIPSRIQGQQKSTASTPSSSVQGLASKSLITLTFPPPAQPTFAQQQPALARDPGRPLDPWQLNNIWRGRPAGPAHTPDFPPHPVWTPRPTSSALHGEVRR